MVGVELEALLQAAYVAAKRVRTETEIGQHPVSIASAAGRIARDVQGDLSSANLLVVGLADMGDIIVEQLRAAGTARLTMSGPSRRTEAAARRLGYGFVPFDALDHALQDAEIIVAAAGTGRHLIASDAMERALVQRRRRPVLLIDAGVPGDVDPGVGDLEGAFLFTLDDLERVAMQGRSTRGAAASAAWDIVDEEVGAWRRSRAGRDAVPAIVALRAHFETAREELLSAEPAADAAEATRMLINRLLHDPSRAMREIAETEAGSQSNYYTAAEQLLRRLFSLGSKEDRKKK
jgi:glutamyl-tRNA reductase